MFYVEITLNLQVLYKLGILYRVHSYSILVYVLLEMFNLLIIQSNHDKSIDELSLYAHCLVIHLAKKILVP